MTRQGHASCSLETVQRHQGMNAWWEGASAVAPDIGKDWRLRIQRCCGVQSRTAKYCVAASLPSASGLVGSQSMHHTGPPALRMTSLSVDGAASEGLTRALALPNSGSFTGWHDSSPSEAPFPEENRPQSVQDNLSQCYPMLPHRAEHQLSTPVVLPSWQSSPRCSRRANGSGSFGPDCAPALLAILLLAVSSSRIAASGSSFCTSNGTGSFTGSDCAA